MNKTRRIWMAALAVLMLALVVGSAGAQGETPLGPWLALYWNNTDLTGDPVVQRSEDALGGRWGLGSPVPGVTSDTFSARWTSFATLDGGRYRFSAISEDGIRVWVGDDLIINNWSVHPETVNTATLNLGPGTYPLRVDYFEQSGLATALLAVERIGAVGDDSGPENVVIAPTSGPPGTTIAVLATGFPANTPVSVGVGVVGSEPANSRTVTTDAAGSLDTTIQLPASATAGETWRVLVIRDGQSALSGGFSVTAGGAPGTGGTGGVGGTPDCGNVYLVQPSDWLLRIARRCNTSVDALLAANPRVTNPNIIYPGQRLVLPGGSAPAAPIVQISPLSGTPGSTVNVLASGFAPSAPLTIEVGPAGQTPSTSRAATANQFGALDTTIQIPAVAAANSDWRVRVSGAGESAVSNPFEVVSSTVTAQTRARTRLRAAPDTNSAIIDVAPTGATLPVIGRNLRGDWVQVRYDGQAGWMAAWLLNIIGDLQSVPIIGTA